MDTHNNSKPSRSVPQLRNPSSSESHRIHPEKTPLILGYTVNTPTQVNTHHASSHIESSLFSPQPSILTISEIESIVRHSTEHTNRALTRKLSRQTRQLPLDYSLPENQENL
jgi:hypothetical protein